MNLLLYTLSVVGIGILAIAVFGVIVFLVDLRRIKKHKEKIRRDTERARQIRSANRMEKAARSRRLSDPLEPFQQTSPPQPTPKVADKPVIQVPMDEPAAPAPAAPAPTPVVAQEAPVVAVSDAPVVAVAEAPVVAVSEPVAPLVEEAPAVEPALPARPPADRTLYLVEFEELAEEVTNVLTVWDLTPQEVELYPGQYGSWFGMDTTVDLFLEGEKAPFLEIRGEMAADLAEFLPQDLPVQPSEIVPDADESASETGGFGMDSGGFGMDSGGFGMDSGGGFGGNTSPGDSYNTGFGGFDSGLDDLPPELRGMAVQQPQEPAGGTSSGGGLFADDPFGGSPADNPLLGGDPLGGLGGDPLGGLGGGDLLGDLGGGLGELPPELRGMAVQQPQDPVGGLGDFDSGFAELPPELQELVAKDSPGLSPVAEAETNPLPDFDKDQGGQRAVLYLDPEFELSEVGRVLQIWQMLPEQDNLQSNQIGRWKGEDGTLVELFFADGSYPYMELNGPMAADLAEFLPQDLPVFPSHQNPVELT